MSATTEANKKSAGGGSSRNRASIYGHRKAITVRMSHDLDARMMAYCNEILTPANTYVHGLIKGALAKADPGSASVKRIGPRATPKVTVTIRLEPDLLDRLKTYCQSTTPSTSVNAFVCGLILKDLKLKSAD